ncbi:MAG: hypothetical protein U0T83_03110 [Bacteriovoracaceae bacterium]
MNFDSVNNLIKWSAKNFGTLPWRKNRTIYHTLVSEIMLQQTTVNTVINKFDPFILKFPDLYKLAKASEEDLGIAWKGLGYYRRAANLKKAALFIVENWGGDIPDEFDKLVLIPGIGKYTANALCSIGHQQPQIAVDVNLERVLGRFYGLTAVDQQALKEKIYTLFNQNKILNNLSKKNAREINEAIMDVGRTLCRNQKADCLNCPLNSECKAYKTKNFSILTSGKIIKDKKPDLELHLLRISIIKNNKLLVYQKEQGEWLNGQWEMPTLILKTDDAKLKQYPAIMKAIKGEEKLKVFKTGITKYKIFNYVMPLTEKEFESTFKKYFKNRKIEFLDCSDKQNFSTATLKAIKL